MTKVVVRLPEPKKQYSEDKNIESTHAILVQKNSEINAFSAHSANLIEEWKDESEDEIWK